MTKNQFLLFGGNHSFDQKMDGSEFEWVLQFVSLRIPKWIKNINIKIDLMCI